MDNKVKKKKQVKFEGVKEEEEEDEILMNMELELATDQLARNDDIDRDYFDKFPPGYRFFPTPKELIIHYLKNKVMNLPMPLNRIRDVNLYNFHPQQLSEMFKMHRENKLYFFTPRTKKYPNGSRPDRAAGNGYWKATGADKKITSRGNVVGLQKTLVFFEGKAKDGMAKKTNWIMHEYKMATKDEDNAAAAASGNSSQVSSVPNNANASTTGTSSSSRPPNDKRLGDWVLCAIHLKPEKAKRRDANDQESSDSLEEGTESDSIDDIDHDFNVFNPDPTQYWSSGNMTNNFVPVISQQVSDSTIVHEEQQQGFRRNMENFVPFYEQVFNPVPVSWDSSRVTTKNVPVMNNQQFPNPTLVQGRDNVIRNMANMNDHPGVRGDHQWGFGNNSQQVSDSTHDLVQGGQGFMTSMENNNTVPLNYGQDYSNNWPISASDQPYLMNYDDQYSTRFLRPAAAAPFNMYNIDHHQHSGCSLDFPAHNYGTSSQEYCQQLPDPPCNEYYMVEIADLPAPLDATTNDHDHGAPSGQDDQVKVVAARQDLVALQRKPEI